MARYNFCIALSAMRLGVPDNISIRIGLEGSESSVVCFLVEIIYLHIGCQFLSAMQI
ncbi:MAG: hypothetical protein II194_00470 [Bacteroidales bacterium]|nr:hypothetical protein [Bacteroidales bacterium]